MQYNFNMQYGDIFRDIFTLSPDPTWIIDEGMFVECNDEAVKTLHYSSKSELKNTHPSVLSPEFQPGGDHSFEKANKMISLAYQKGVHRFEWLHKKKTGEIFPVEVTLSLINLKGKEVLYCIWRDITDRKKMEIDQGELIKKLKLAKINSDSANQSKGVFISNISHEMRTPLNLIIGATQSLLEDEMLDDQKDRLHNIMVSGETLLILINDILDMSQIESEGMKINDKVFILRDEFNRIVEMFKGKFTRNSLALELDIDNNISKHYYGDAKRIGQILINLIGNSFKFTEKGSVKIKVNKDDRDMIMFSIIDTGVGIPKDKQCNLFERFARVENRLTEKYTGSGVGLNICKSLVEMMGGNIGMSSEDGGGSKFYFSLPLKEGNINDLDNKMESNDKLKTMKKLRILSVDDSEENQFVLKLIFKDTGHTLVTCLSAKEGIDFLKQGMDFDLILMDIQMTEMSGLEAIEIIRGIEKEFGKKVKIVAITGYSTDEYKQKCLDAGADYFYTKPIIKDDFFQKLSHFF